MFLSFLAVMERLDRSSPTFIVHQRLFELAMRIFRNRAPPKKDGLGIRTKLTHLPIASKHVEDSDGDRFPYAEPAVFPHHEKLSNVTRFFIARDSTSLMDEREAGVVTSRAHEKGMAPSLRPVRVQ